MNRKVVIKAIFGFGLFILIFSGSSRAQEQDSKAYTLFIYNFMKYVEWPEGAVKQDFVMGVSGDSPILTEVQNLAKAKKVKGKTILVKKIATPDEALECNMVFICSRKSLGLKPVLEKVKGKPILIVGETEGLADKGAALSFVILDDDNLKFDINKKALEAQSLKISTQLVNLGIVVK